MREIGIDVNEIARGRHEIRGGGVPCDLYNGIVVHHTSKRLSQDSLLWVDQREEHAENLRNPVAVVEAVPVLQRVEILQTTVQRSRQALFQFVGTQLKLSFAYHPKTDGQTKRVNQVIEDMLRSYYSQ